MARSKITETGRKKLCKAHAGDIVLPRIAQMALGDGGLDTDGKLKEATGNEIALYHELLRKNIDSHTYLNEEATSCRYSLRIDKEELAGETISEIGLYDEEGDLVAYKTCPGLGKDEFMEFIFNCDEIFLNV